MNNYYAVYDSKAECYMTPFMNKTHGLALRTFELAVQDRESIVCKYPADFTLFHIAVWDEYKGTIISLDTPISLGLAIEYTEKTDLQAVK